MPGKSAASSWYVVVVLGLLYFFSWIDRLVLSLLIEPIQSDLGVSDMQVSLLFGTSFAIFYAAFSFPLARIADKGNRRNLIILGVVIWCLMTMMNGFASAFWMLIVFRIGLAFGEAALSPAALSIISDNFPRERRALPLSTYSVFGQIGGTYGLTIAALAVGLIGAGPALTLPLLGEMRQWQVVFLIVGFPGLILALIVYLTIREPARSDTGSEGAAEASAIEALPYLRQNWRLYTFFLGGLAVPTVIIFAMTGWMPTLLIRDFGWTAAEAGARLGTAMAISGVAGILCIPWTSEKLTHRGWALAIPIVGMISVVVETAAFVAAMMMDSPYAMIGFLMITTFFISGAGVLPALAIHTLAPNRMRGLLIAISFSAVSLIGMGTGPTMVAFFSEFFFTGRDALAPAMALTGAVAAPIALILLWMSRGPYLEKRQRAMEAIAAGRPIGN